MKYSEMMLDGFMVTSHDQPIWRITLETCWEKGPLRKTRDIAPWDLGQLDTIGTWSGPLGSGVTFSRRAKQKNSTWTVRAGLDSGGHGNCWMQCVHVLLHVVYLCTLDCVDLNPWNVCWRLKSSNNLYTYFIRLISKLQLVCQVL